eukprot:PhF_6_TR39658/c0_g2_i1/m.58855
MSADHYALRLNMEEGYKADDGTVVKFHTDWMKSHQIEGDGLLPLLYHYLFKKDKDFKSSPGARIPDTVVYEHNFPRAWYSYESKSKEITKRAGKFLDVGHIYESFSRQEEYRGKRRKYCDIVAQYMYSRTCDDGTVEMNVEFFTDETLKQFLTVRRNRPDGVLQKFLIPKGTSNTQLQAVFSNRVTRIYKRTAIFRLDDRTKTPYERAVTFDGPSHLSEETIVSEKVQAEVRTICQNFVKHFNETEHKPITRMCMFFKMDEYDRLWIVSASSIRIGGTKFAPSTLRIPLNLATKFATSDVAVLTKKNAISGEQFEENLLHRDMKLYELSHDFLFTKLHCMKEDSATRAQTARQNASRAHSPPLHYNEVDVSPRNPFYNVISKKQVCMTPRPPTISGGGVAGMIQAPMTARPPPSSGGTPRYQRKDMDWYMTGDSSIRDAYNTLVKQENTVRCFVKDTIYDVYSNALEETPTTHTDLSETIEIPSNVVDVLKASELETILFALGLERDEVEDNKAHRITSHAATNPHSLSQSELPPMSASSGTSFVGGVSGTIARGHRAPVYNIIRTAEAAVTHVFEERKLVLKNETAMNRTTTSVEHDLAGTVNTLRGTVRSPI